VNILKYARDYARLKPLADDLKKLRVVQNHKDHREVFEQARLLDQAALRASSKDKKDAIAKYEQVVRKWPDSAAAKLAGEKLSELGAQVVIVDAPSKNPSGGTAVKPAAGSTAKPPKGGKVDKAVAQRQAKGLLDTAETLAKINPAEAKKKAQQVLDLVPGTDLAKRAEALIKKL
jgi:hypothetical protein